MNSQPLIIDGLNNDRLQNLYRDASAVRISEKTRRLTNQGRSKGLLASLNGVLARIGVANRPASANAGSIAGR